MHNDVCSRFIDLLIVFSNHLQHYYVIGLQTLVDKWECEYIARYYDDDYSDCYSDTVSVHKIFLRLGNKCFLEKNSCAYIHSNIYHRIKDWNTISEAVRDFVSEEYALFL